LGLAIAYNNWFGQQPPVKSLPMSGAQVAVVAAMTAIRAALEAVQVLLERHLL
jgi:hypothetical protein